MVRLRFLPLVGSGATYFPEYYSVHQSGRRVVMQIYTSELLLPHVLGHGFAAALNSSIPRRLGVTLVVSLHSILASPENLESSLAKIPARCEALRLDTCISNGAWISANMKKAQNATCG